MTTYSQAEIIGVLEGHGLSWQRFFVFNRGLVAFHDERGQRMLLIIEDDHLNSAVCKFLHSHGLELNESGG